MYYSSYPTYLAHHGIKGQRWGIRRFQNPDGTLTEEGLRRYGKSIERGRQLAERGQTKGKIIAKTAVKQAGIVALAAASTVPLANAVNNVAFKKGAKYLAGLQGTLDSAKLAKAAMLGKNPYLMPETYKLAAATLGISGQLGGLASAGSLITLGAGTAKNLYKGIRDYKDLKNYEIVSGSRSGK